MHKVNGYLSFRMVWTASAWSLPQQAPPASFRCCLCTLDCVKNPCVSIYASPGCRAVLRPQEVLPSLLAELRCINTERHDLEPPCQSLYTNRTDLDKDERSSPLDERGRHCCISTASTQKKPNWWWGPSKTWLSQPSLLSCSQLHHSETSWAILSTVRKRSSGDCSIAKHLSGMCEVSSPILLQFLESPKETKK